jgi:uncharacterized repeat protein (TIGR01451 family)
MHRAESNTARSVTRSAQRHALALLAVVAASWQASPAGAAGTPAGTLIENTAEVRYDVAGESLARLSNTVRVQVAEILAAVLVAESSPMAAAPGATGLGLRYRLTNTGNGSEQFVLAATSTLPGDDFDPLLPAQAIHFDSDGSGDFSAADEPYLPGSNDPLLAPDESVVLLVVNSIPEDAADTAVGLTELVATAASGTGAPGTVLPGAGDDGIDAITGAGGGSARATGEYLVSALDLAFAKRATVRDPWGGDRPTPGARITYELEVVPTGSGNITDAFVEDPIPANTSYLPGSLTLNGVPLSDAGDADSGEFVNASTAAIRVQLGALTGASGSQTVTFTVVID